MKAAILQYDHVLTKFQPRFGNYPVMIQSMFTGFDYEIVFDTFDCRQGLFPANINNYDIFLTTGSRASVYEKREWIEKSLQFIKRLHKEKKILIGICFGHQLIAEALGGKVEKSCKGWGIGVATNRIVTQPEWRTDKYDSINILTSHQDQIVLLPDDALVLAESDFCPFFIVQWGDTFLSIQGHPEWNADYSRALINERKNIIPADRVQSGLKSLEIPLDNALFLQWITEFVDHANSADRKR